MYRDNKYKDELPINTINKIKNKLRSLGFIVEESEWKNSLDGFYSLSVSIKGTKLRSNGKGTTKEYARASAYAEFIERLQNQSFFRLGGNLSEDSYNAYEFFYGPDEKYLTVENLLNSKEEWINSQYRILNKRQDRRKILNEWKNISYSPPGCDFVALPYMNLCTNKISNIPVGMLSKMYMSNGMCAGNTKEEALVQGLSEVFERFANVKIVSEKLTPPNIPMSYIKKFPRVYKMIKEIKSSGNYDILVKDCSLNKGYPSLCIIYINKTDQTYFVKFGAHPIFEIALERCLTELLQGQEIWNMKGVREFEYKDLIMDEEKNILGILVNGVGAYPIELFKSNPSYEFSEFDDLTNLSNKKLLNYMIDILSRDDYEVYVRDVSFLDFPSYSIVVPHFSEVDKFDEIDKVIDYSEYTKIKKMILYLRYLSEEEKKELIYLMEKNDMSGLSTVMDFIGLSYEKLFAWHYNFLDLFLCMLCYSVGDFKKAYKYIDYYLKNIFVAPNEKRLYSHYKCIRDYIGTRSDNLSDKDSINILKNFYSDNNINTVIENFKDHKTVLNRFGMTKCFECSKCRFNDSCTYKNYESVYLTLKKECMKKNINQCERLINTYK